MINQKQQTLFVLVSEVDTYFTRLSYSDNWMRILRKGWKALAEFMKEHSFDFYDPTVGKAFIESILGDSLYAGLSRMEKDIIRSTNVITEYQTTGVIKFRSVLKSYEFEGEIGKLILGFLDFRKLQGLSKDTLDSNRLYLHRFLDYLITDKVFYISNMDKQHILGFINGLGFYSKATIHCMLCSLRSFLRYLCDNKYTILIFPISYQRVATERKRISRLLIQKMRLNV